MNGNLRLMINIYWPQINITSPAVPYGYLRPRHTHRFCLWVFFLLYISTYSHIINNQKPFWTNWPCSSWYRWLPDLAWPQDLGLTLPGLLDPARTSWPYWSSWTWWSLTSSPLWDFLILLGLLNLDLCFVVGNCNWKGLHQI